MQNACGWRSIPFWKEVLGFFGIYNLKIIYYP